MPFSKIKKAYDLHRSVSTDTRKIRKGDVFFALKGDNFNGNLYAKQALEAGASLAVIDEAEFLPEGDVRFALVDDVLLALQNLAREVRKEFEDIPFIAITGTNGKTTTKELMYAALSVEKKVHATAGNLNNHIGVPLTLLSMPQDTEIAIIEMGANKLDDIKELVEIALPTHGMITNIGLAHLKGFGSIDGVQQAKGEMFDFLRKNGGNIFLNMGDKRVVAEAVGNIQLVSYGSAEALFEVMEVENKRKGMVLYIGKGKERELEEFAVQIIGDHNVENVLAAVVVGNVMGISTAGIREGIGNYRPKMNRTELIEAEGRTILLDAYNANPSSMAAAVRTVGQQAQGPAALILGDMFELGPDSLDMHRELVGYVREHLQGALLIGIGKDMTEAVRLEAPTQRHYVDVADAAPHIATDLEGREFILIKGSRGMALEGLLPHLGVERS